MRNGSSSTHPIQRQKLTACGTRALLERSPDRNLRTSPATKLFIKFLSQSNKDNGVCSVFDSHGNITESQCDDLHPFVCVRRPGKIFLGHL